MKNEIYIGTVCLEMNRHAGNGAPTYRVGEWRERFAEVGFDGMELWEYHATQADDVEMKRLTRDGPCPVKLFNSYAGLDPDEAARRRQTADIARALGAAGIKWNFAFHRDDPAPEMEVACDWFRQFEPGMRLLCECHRGTSVDTPDIAARVLPQLGHPGVSVIVHAFGDMRDDTPIRAWFEKAGELISHVHVRLRGDGGRFIRLDREAEAVRKRLRLLADLGFAGSYTIEFTEGIKTENENIEALFANAVKDLQFLKSHV